jgi:hypothetical protein
MRRSMPGLGAIRHKMLTESLVEDPIPCPAVDLDVRMRVGDARFCREEIDGAPRAVVGLPQQPQETHQMARRSMPILIAVGLGLALLWAGAASATTAPFKVKLCTLKQWHQFEGESKEKDKDKLRRFVIDGSFGTLIEWQLRNRLALQFAARIDGQRKATLIKDAAIDPTTIQSALMNYGFNDAFTINSYRLRGNRTVNATFKKSKDKFNLRVNLTFSEGSDLGRTMTFGAKATCKGKRVR